MFLLMTEFKSGIILQISFIDKQGATVFKALYNEERYLFL